MNRFRVSKIGLLNFWFYDEEEFDFYGGKLILRGANGSGKSVTMQSFIPLILDGNKSPDRLDPFGSRERKIEDYVLGDAEGVQKEEATSYLYMECFKEDEKKYVTIGLGFRGRKGRPVESWGFAIVDGKRIGKDFFLYKDAANKIPLTKNELKSRLGTINFFLETMKEYKQKINQLLFGFPTLDAYDEFIKLLLQLRSNKLSKDYKPTNLINVLNTVLQPLTEEDLRPLSEAIEQMNKTKEQIETLEKNHKSLKDFLKVYQNYNSLNLLAKTRNYKYIADEYQEIEKKVKRLEQELSDNKNTLENNGNRFIKVNEEIAVNIETKNKLDNGDLKRQVESLATITNNINTLEEKIKEITIKIDNYNDEKLDISKKITNLEEEIYHLQKEIKDIIIELKDLVETTYFTSLTYFLESLEENSASSFDGIFLELKKYQSKISLIMDYLKEEQKILLDSEKARVDLEKLNKTYQEYENSLKNMENNIRESIMSWEEDFINKLNNNKELKLNEFTKEKIFKLMNDYTKDNFDEVKNLYYDYAQELINSLKSDNLNYLSKINIKNQELIVLKDEYAQIENNNDFELPIINEETEEFLKINHIANVPLYKCIEFKDNLGENIKNNLEAALLDLNILNAKIINPKDISKLNKLNTPIVYLAKSTKKKNNLLKYFKVTIPKDINISLEYVEEVLASISVDLNDSVAINEEGFAKIDIINVIADSNYKQTFIGYLKRCEARKIKLKTIQEQMEVLDKEIANLNNLVKTNQEKQDIIANEKHNLPSNKLINEVLNKKEELDNLLEWTDQKRKDLEQKVSDYNAQIRQIKENIFANKEGINVPLNLKAFQEAKVALDSTNDILHQTKIYFNNLNSKKELLASLNIRLEENLNNVAYLETDKSERNKELQVNLASKKTIDALLETKEFKDQKEKLVMIENNLKNLNTEKEHLISLIAGLKKDIEYDEDTLAKLKEEKERKCREKDAYYEVFLREYNLKYIYQDEIVNIDTTIKRILNDGKDKKEIDLTNTLSNFYSAFYKYSLELNDYSLKEINLFLDYEDKEDSLKKIYEAGSRKDISCMYQGIRVNLLELCQKLEDDILENKDLINKQDRYLFEEILLNTVGDKIRQKIQSSKEWVKKINNIMATMQENSALSFKLVWKSITAEALEEIDTKELVRILEINPELLNDADKAKLTNHFRSKIKKAEEEYADSYISFAKIMEKVLDYRTWFTFQLLYQRKGMDYKELTDKTFAKFSGGERAKSMYIPLFASVYAKLNSALPHALRLIALDEAFAGVDEDNIREMFGILKYLDIDFVINSQVLWGDYDTIDDLAICELIRPYNSNIVTVERYRWNGHYKEIINNRKQYNEEINNA